MTIITSLEKFNEPHPLLSYTNSDAGGFPNIYPRKPIVLELTNGLLLGGDYQRHPPDYVPDWIIPPHRAIGQYQVFLHSPFHTWTSNLREQNINSHIENLLPLQLYVEIPEGRRISATHFVLVDTRHEYDFSGSAAYIAMPDGSVYISRLM